MSHDFPLLLLVKQELFVFVSRNVIFVDAKQNILEDDELEFPWNNGCFAFREM